MAFAGLKKQINKCNQYMTEKMGGAEGTKLDLEFVDMERKTDVTFELVDELQLKTKEYLQPNPTARAKMAAVKGISKLSGQAKASTYPQSEGVLGETMVGYGKKLGDDSIFGQALAEFGEGLKQMADVKYSLDDNCKQNFLEPLHHLQTKDLKEVMHHRKKLQGRRLDFDCKRRRQAKGLLAAIDVFLLPTDDEIKQAEEKFAESLHLAQMGMFNLLENDVEQVSQLTSFAEALYEYHQQCTEILRTVVENLQEKRNEAANRPRSEFVPKTLADLHVEGISEHEDYNGTSQANSPTHKPNQLELITNNQPRSTNASPMSSPIKSSPARTPAGQTKGPCCTALYDFDPENPGELGFKEGDTIALLNKIDENWLEGSVNGRTGYFPVTYVQVVVPLP
ncbi:endophilin-A isoform X2 [Macrosteles quadrilineatus]|uniref:endophilin-A isoform X2 n=1 Tax=Macrosteles quadrilineatus TaxID=74068 RepID=UPI0023E0DEF0|nr:endophilin-A isoform X2 [Macrosteles quadrilineatus]XP_054285773.1 endophilin-A isoform X2 [Macrosteles quadrilineatus]